MKKSKVWITIPIYWILFLIYSMFLDRIWLCFPIGDFIEGSDEYHYGPCSFSITVSFVLLVLGLIYVAMSRKREKDLKGSKRIRIVVIGALVLSFVLQFFFFLSHFSYFYLFGIVVW